MKRMKKLVAGLLAALSVVASSVGLTACVLTGGGSGSGKNSGSGSSSDVGDNSSSVETSSSITSEAPQPKGVVYEIVDGSAQVVDYDGSETSVTIEATYEGVPVTKIGNEAFKGCTSLTEIVIPESVTVIGNFAFEDCSGFKEFVIPDNVTSIGANAFLNCTSLTSVTIGSGVTSIGDGAFDYSTALMNITFNGTTEEWNEIDIAANWKAMVTVTKVVCTDGEVDL